MTTIPDKPAGARREYVRFLTSNGAANGMDEAFREKDFLSFEQVLAPAFSQQAYLTEEELPHYDLIELMFVFRNENVLERRTVATPDEVPFAARNPYAVYMAFIKKLAEARPAALERVLKGCLFEGALPFDLLGLARERNGNERWRYFYVFAEAGVRPDAIEAAGWLPSDFLPFDASRCWPFFKRDLGWFLAHRSQDFHDLQVVKSLLSHRFAFWVDEDHMSYGAHWLLLVHLALKCCRGMVVVCTDELQRELHAVSQELDLARVQQQLRPDFQVVKLFFTPTVFTDGLPDDEPGKVMSFQGEKDGGATLWMESLSHAGSEEEQIEIQSRSGQDIKRFHVLAGDWGARLLQRDVPSLPEMFAGSRVGPLADGDKAGKGIVQFSFLVRDCNDKVLLVGRLNQNHSLTTGGTVMISWSPFTDSYSGSKRFYPAREADIRAIYHKEVRESEELDTPRFTYLGLVTNKIKGIHYWMYIFVATYPHDGEWLKRNLYLQKDKDDMEGFYEVSQLIPSHQPFMIGSVEAIKRGNKADWQALKMLACGDAAFPSDWDWGESRAVPFMPPDEASGGGNCCLPPCLLEKGCLFLSYADETGRNVANALREAIERRCRQEGRRISIYVPGDETELDADYLRCSFATVFLCTAATPESPRTARDCRIILEIVGDVHRLPTYQIVKLPLERGASAGAVSPPNMSEWRTCNAWLESDSLTGGERIDRVAGELLRIVTP